MKIYKFFQFEEKKKNVKGFTRIILTQTLFFHNIIYLNFSFDILDAITSLDLQGDCFAGQGLDEDLHTSSKPENQVKSRFLLNIVIRQSSSILQLLSSEDQSLLIWRNSFLVLDLGLDVLDAITSLDLQGNGFTGQGLDKDLHTSSKPENQMKSRFLLYVVIG